MPASEAVKKCEGHMKKYFKQRENEDVYQFTVLPFNVTLFSKKCKIKPDIVSEFLYIEKQFKCENQRKLASSTMLKKIVTILKQSTRLRKSEL